MRTLYFTVVPLESPGNGGSICCRNHVERLAADPGIELFAMTAGHLAWREGTEAFFAGLNVPHHFQPFRNGNFHHAANSAPSIVDFAFKAIFQFPWEMQALNQQHIDIYSASWGPEDDGKKFSEELSFFLEEES